MCTIHLSHICSTNVHVVSMYGMVMDRNSKVCMCIPQLALFVGLFVGLN